MMALRKNLILRKPRSGCLDGAARLRRMRRFYDGIKKKPHPEEAAKRLSRRTHGAGPGIRRVLDGIKNILILRRLAQRGLEGRTAARGLKWPHPTKPSPVFFLLLSGET